MKPQSGLRGHASGSIRPPPTSARYTLSGSESSDGDDEDIPAVVNRLASRSPLKRPPALSPSRFNANPLKRSPSDPARAAIALYPASKKPRNGYNMGPTSKKFLPNFTIGCVHPPRPTTSTTSLVESPDQSAEEDVCEGLTSSLNDAFRHVKSLSQAQTSREKQFQQGEGSPPQLLKGAKPVKLSDKQNIDHQDPDLRPAIVSRSSFDIAVPSQEVRQASKGAHGTVPAEDRDRGRATSPSPTQVESTLRKGNQPESDSPLRSDDNACEMSRSPEEPHRKEELQNAAPCNDQKPQPIKKSGRQSGISNISKVSDSAKNGDIAVEKRKVGRPRKLYSYIRDDGDDGDTRTAMLRKKSMLSVLDEEVESSRGLSPAPNENDTVQLTHAKDAEEVSQYGEPEMPTHVNTDFASLEYVDEHRSTDTADDKLSSDPIDGSDLDTESDPSMNQPGEDSFIRDVLVFNAHKTVHLEDDEAFEGPSDDDVTTIHLDHRPIMQLCKLLSDASWTGLKRGDWQWQHFDYHGAETKPARVLLPLLAKLERLYLEMPQAPKLKEQSQFLREYAPMLRFYFYKIQMAVEHIRARRLEIPERNGAALNTDPVKRKRMTRDLVLYVIPMLVHVLASAWNLGGQTWFNTSFTGAAVELLLRVLGWIMALDQRLLTELNQSPLEKKPESQHQQKIWEKVNARREEIGPLLDNLSRVIMAAPDELAKAEARSKRALRRDQDRLKREEQLKKQQKAAEEAVSGPTAGRIKRSHPSTHAPNASFPPSPSRATGTTVWTYEEKKTLFRYIQNSYPVCPDLDHIRWGLNKTFDETATMTEHLLEKILATVSKDSSVEERTAKIRKIMRS